jgi:hypothetical protein
MEAAYVEEHDPYAPKQMDEDPQVAVIADVATDPDSDGNDVTDDPMVLEVAVGRVHELHVVVPIFEEDGSHILQVAKGGVFSYYEFGWPASDRLTDEKWRQMVAEGQTPALPVWTQSFFVDEGEYWLLQVGIQDFQGAVTKMFWEPQEIFSERYTAVLANFSDEIQDLRAAKRYVGHQLISTDFRSFDLQSSNRAVVTVREAWQDILYARKGEHPAHGDPSIGERGPYTLDVTYTLEAEALADGMRWYVTRAVYASEPPPW